MFSVYPAEEDAATTVRLLSPMRAAAGAKLKLPRLRSARRRRAAAWVAAMLLAVGTIAGIRFAVDYVAHYPDPYGGPGATAAGSSGSGAASRAAWAQRYGQNRAAMPNLPDVASATAEQRGAAGDLLTRTEAGTAGYANTDAAQAAGYDFAGALTRAKSNPVMSQRLSRIDAGATPLRPVVLRAVNKSFIHHGKVLDPAAPQALIYTYQGQDTWKLAGATFRADASYPNPPPDPGGPITRWRYVDMHPAVLTMDVFFVAGVDLAHAYALRPPSR